MACKPLGTTSIGPQTEQKISNKDLKIPGTKYDNIHYLITNS